MSAVLMNALVLTLAVTACEGQHAAPQPPSPSPAVSVWLPESSVVVDPASYSFGAWPTAAQLPRGAPSAWVLARTTRQVADGFAQLSGPASVCQQPAEPGQPVPGPGPTGVQEQQYVATNTDTHASASFDETQTFYADSDAARQAYALFADSFLQCAQTLGTAAPQGGTSAVRHSARRTVTGANGGAWVHTVVSAANGAKAQPDQYDYAIVYGNVLTTATFDAPGTLHAALPDPEVVRMLSRALGAYDVPPVAPAFPVSGASALWQAWPLAEDLPVVPGLRWTADGTSQSQGGGLPGQSGPLGGMACTAPYGPDENPVVAGHQGSGYTLHAVEPAGSATPGSGTAPTNTAPSKPSNTVPTTTVPANTMPASTAPSSTVPSSTAPSSTAPVATASGDLLFLVGPALAQDAYTRLVQDMATCQDRVRADQRLGGAPGDAVVTQVPVPLPVPAAAADAQDGAAWTITGTGTAVWEQGRVYTAPGVSTGVNHSVLFLVRRGPLVESLIVHADGPVAAAFTPAADAKLLAAMGKAVCSFAIGC